MRCVIFDSSTIISLAINNLLWILEPLKKQFNGEFFIPKSVKMELVDVPLKTKKFKLEALMITELITKGVISVYENKEVEEKTEKLMDIINHIFKARGHWIIIIQKGEVEALALADHLKAIALVVDERTTRLIVEDPEKLRELFEKKLHTKVSLNQQNMNLFKKSLNHIQILRSSELVVLVYELGLFNRYIGEESKKFVKGDLNKILLEALLWGVKLRGCAITSTEIDEIIEAEAH